MALVSSALGQASGTQHYQSGGRAVAYDVFDAGAAAPLVILLPGTSGPETPYYRDRAGFLQSKGYTVYLLHYYDAWTSRQPSDASYAAWAKAVADLVSAAEQPGLRPPSKVALEGFSLGASVALAAGSQGAPVAAIAEWYGSLPDAFFHTLQGMPPLLILHGARDQNIPVINAQQLVRLCSMLKVPCENHIYPDQCHGFMGSGLADADQRTLLFLAEELK